MKLEGIASQVFCGLPILSFRMMREDPTQLAPDTTKANGLRPLFLDTSKRMPSTNHISPTSLMDS